MTGSTLVDCGVASLSLSVFVITRLWSVISTLIILYNRYKVVSDNSIQNAQTVHITFGGR